GFIGSCFVDMALKRSYKVVNVDKVTYAARKDLDFDTRPGYMLIKKDICDLTSLPDKVECVVNFAAESHVDNSIRGSSKFMQSNTHGVYNLLELVRRMEPAKRPLFIQISTDEVYGDIIHGSFRETDPLKPSNPYSATKAAAEELVMGWGRTHGIRYKITRSSNNYGPGQSNEKFIPNIIMHANRGEKARVYGKGLNSREWTYAADNCAAIFLVMEKGKDNEIYNISSSEELTNLEVVKKVLKAVGKPTDFFEFVADRPGHDVRYSVNSTKIASLGWKPSIILDMYLASL
ncbi:MAG: GDP-mannose 4,6-dehydratase, partial [Candidatus Taylorbacteria bacterium]|nr:GDP-mannose 4,6-dehydratase [Candidatus Taylorbacteria bacterium]